jgi:hypothetical protein
VGGNLRRVHQMAHGSRIALAQLMSVPPDHRQTFVLRAATTAEEATRRVEALRDRLRDFLLSLPAEGQIEVTEVLNKELDRWEQWIERTGTWHPS